MFLTKIILTLVETILLIISGYQVFFTSLKYKVKNWYVHALPLTLWVILIYLVDLYMKGFQLSVLFNLFPVITWTWYTIYLVNIRYFQKD